MCSSDQNDAQEHSEVEHLEYFRLGETQHDYSGEFRQCDAAEDVASHLSQCFGDPQVGRGCAGCIRMHNVTAKFDRYSDALKLSTFY